MKRGAAAALAVAVLGVGGCGRTIVDPPKTELLVFAAASLTESFTEIGEAFERDRRDVRVFFNWGPSDGLANGIRGGGRADAFASASRRWMDLVASTPGVTDRAIFARTVLTIIVPKDNPAGIRTFPDLAKPGVKLVLAARGVPAGQYAREAMSKANIGERNVVSNEEDVKGVVQKVVLGEADAGIVYATDVTPTVRSNASVIAIPDDVNVVASYEIAVVRETKHVAAARAFVAYVLDQGQAVLRAAGFGAP